MHTDIPPSRCTEPCRNSRHLSCLSSRHLSFLSSRHLSCFNSRHLSPEDIYPVSTADIKSWLAEAATAADQINDRESLACGGRDSGRPKSLHGAMDDPSLTAKTNRHRHIACSCVDTNKSNSSAKLTCPDFSMLAFSYFA